MAKIQYKIECILCGKLLGYGSIDSNSPGSKSKGYCQPCHEKSKSLTLNVPNIAEENRARASKVIEMIEQGKISAADAIVQLAGILSKRTS